MDKDIILDEINKKIGDFLNKAKKIFLRDYLKVNKYQTKNNFRDLVTDTDKEIEQLFIKWLSGNFPSHKVVGEESGNHIGEFNGWYWCIDPIDGTTSFIHKIPDCAIMISVLYNKIPQMSWIVYPSRNETFFAQNGKGAYLNGKPIKINSGTSLSDSLTFAVVPGDFEKFSNIYRNIWGKFRGIRLPGSIAECFSSMCLNRNQISILYKANLWEYPAGCLLVQEAGGYFVNFNGNKISFTKQYENIVLANSSNLLKEVIDLMDTNKL